jgi:hypothetical protein
MKFDLNHIKLLLKDSDIDCGDNSCRFTLNHCGMRTNGGCRCLGSRSLVNWTPVERHAVKFNPNVIKQLIDRIDDLEKEISNLKEELRTSELLNDNG